MAHICPICKIPYEFDENGEIVECHSANLEYGLEPDSDLGGEYE